MIYKYDGIGQQCPVPLVRLRLLLKKMQTGDHCIITMNDIGSIQDIPKLLSKQGFKYLIKEKGNGVIEINVTAQNLCGTKLK
jgi:tRNA 2-thiouridine synthesizing protein A